MCHTNRTAQSLPIYFLSDVLVSGKLSELCKLRRVYGITNTNQATPAD